MKFRLNAAIIGSTPRNIIIGNLTAPKAIPKSPPKNPIKEHKIKRASNGRHVFILVIGKSYLSDPKDCAIVAKNKS